MQKDHVLLSLKDTFSRYRPSVAEHMYEVGVKKNLAWFF